MVHIDHHTRRRGLDNGCKNNPNLKRESAKRGAKTMKDNDTYVKAGKKQTVTRYNKFLKTMGLDANRLVKIVHSKTNESVFECTFKDLLTSKYGNRSSLRLYDRCHNRNIIVRGWLMHYQYMFVSGPIDIRHL